MHRLCKEVPIEPGAGGSQAAKDKGRGSPRTVYDPCGRPLERVQFEDGRKGEAREEEASLMVVMSRALQERKIREDLVRNGLDPQTTDVYALVDGRLSLPENRRNIARKLGYSVGVKTTSVRAQKKRETDQYCTWRQEDCEVNGNQESCHAYKRDCSAPSKVKKGTATPAKIRKAAPVKTHAQMHEGQCMIPVAAHWRRCSPRTAERLSNQRKSR